MRTSQTVNEGGYTSFFRGSRLVNKEATSARKTLGALPQMFLVEQGDFGDARGTRSGALGWRGKG